MYKVVKNIEQYEGYNDRMIELVEIESRTLEEDDELELLILLTDTWENKEDED